MEGLFQQNTYQKPLYHLNDVILKVNEILANRVVENGSVDPDGACKDVVQVSQACSTLTKNIFFYEKGLMS